MTEDVLLLVMVRARAFSLNSPLSWCPTVLDDDRCSIAFLFLSAVQVSSFYAIASHTALKYGW